MVLLGDGKDLENMFRKLSKQLTGKDWVWNNLNTLCWAIGSISGSMMEEQENRFLVMVIRDLLNLCEITKREDNKAVIASNIMYAVGRYARFLGAYWKFLKTVVKNLFELMHEAHPGVQDMACHTFFKFVKKCKRKFVLMQVEENEPFVSELLATLSTTIADLEPHQIHSFYESVGHMIQAEPDPQRRYEYQQRLIEAIELLNQKWAETIGQARQSADYLKDQDVIRTVFNIFQISCGVTLKEEDNAVTSVKIDLTDGTDDPFERIKFFQGKELGIDRFDIQTVKFAETAHGINSGDVKNLLDAGIYICNGLMMHPKKNLTGFNGPSEAKVDKKCEADEMLMKVGYMTGSDAHLRRKAVVRITTGSEALDELLAGGIETRAVTKAWGIVRSGKTQLTHSLCVTTQLPTSMHGGNGKLAYTDTEGTFQPDYIVPIAQRFGMDPEAVLDNITLAYIYTNERQCNLLLGLTAIASEEPFSLLVEQDC